MYNSCQRPASWRNSSALRTAAVIAVAAFSILGYGAIATLSGRTLIRLWIPIAAALAIAAIPSAWLLPAWRWLTGLSNNALCLVCHAVAAVGILAGAAYVCNYAFPDTSTLHEVDATVAARRTEVRHKSKRVSRRVYTQGEPYTVYYIDLRLPGGDAVSLGVQKSRYSRIRVGDTLQLPVERGLLGIPVVRPADLYPESPRAGRR